MRSGGQHLNSRRVNVDEFSCVNLKRGASQERQDGEHQSETETKTEATTQTQRTSLYGFHMAPFCVS